MVMQEGRLEVWIWLVCVDAENNWTVHASVLRYVWI